LKQDLLDWGIRSFVYEYIVEHGIPPAFERAAEEFGIEAGSARAAYERLHERHALLLDAETREVRMAFPFSAIPTRFLVRVNDRSYWANCAWDMLGVPAALHSDAEIERSMPGTARWRTCRWRTAGCRVTTAWFTSRCRSGAGTTTWSSPERTSCSSGRRRLWTRGARPRTDPGARP
jgi:hypothetical protein